MLATELLLTALDRNWDMIDDAMDGMDDAMLARIPASQCNSIAWILWHLNRVMDGFVTTRLRNQPQMWVEGGWAQRFGMAPDPEDRGVGWTAEQVAAWKPPAREVLLGYYQAVRSEARGFLAGLTEQDFEKRVVFPAGAEPRTAASALGQMTWDIVAHGGQIAYLRGFYKGIGWHR
ncbi:MAG: hypothetical protein BZY80_01535 [SAR202 cluster bacterium Io17-Chloro-G2]|nr:MAG: hypothetical protein BZY80_01535 [SAR202 cluster bacterium Io17-Chloro-G2]